MTKGVFGIVSVLVALGCVRLGFWQLSRLGERRALNAEVMAQLDREPVRLVDVDSAAVYRRVRAVGVYDTTAMLVEVLRTWNGIPGAYVVSPLRLPDGRAVLVERGWVDAPDGQSVDVTSLARGDSVTIEGFVTPVLEEAVAYHNRWPLFVRGADPRAAAGVLPYPLLPILVRRTGGTDDPGVRALDRPQLDDGPHLSYAIQWFAFAVIAVVGAAAYVRREPGAESREPRAGSRRA